MTLNFEVVKNCLKTKARVGKLVTKNTDVITPIFMPVGTHGAVRSQRIEEIASLGYQLLLANTYHLMLRPKIQYFIKHGELRKFSGWNGGFLTDSGGFQVFSLSHARQITEEGVVFRSHIDGQKLLLTPELSIQAQTAFKSDIMMVLDECTASTVNKSQAKIAIDRTHRWAKRSLSARADLTQGIFGIVQGACYQDLRIESAQYLSELPFCGLAIGGLAVGETKDEREAMTDLVTNYLPTNKPRYLMGVGTPLDILEAVRRGVDMFDCVLPTILGQQGVAFTSFGKIDLRKSAFFEDNTPIDENCECSICKKYSKSYIHHLIKTYDVSVASFIGYHNLAFIARMMTDIRRAICEDKFFDFYQQKQKELGQNTLKDNSISNSKNIYQVLERKNQQGKYIVSIKHRPSGEVMHSSLDPIVESRRLYVEQANLLARIKASNLPLTIWDVGLGAATNASGVIEAFEQIKKPINLISFEISLEPLSLVLNKKFNFTHANHPWIEKIFSKKEVNENGFYWKLYLGDFLQTADNAPMPDLIYYDPFSYKVDTPLWTISAFKKLNSWTKSKPMVAFTFSSATRVRVAMLSAGFYVAKGLSTGKKQETTIFLNKLALEQESYPLLGQDWLTKWKRSHSKYPQDLEDNHKEEFESGIINHPQFV